MCVHICISLFQMKNIHFRVKTTKCVREGGVNHT